VSSAGKDRGSCFTVKLPLMSTDPAFAPQASARESSKLSALKITVVDDNQDAADSLGALLETMGCTVQIYYSGAEALQALDAFNPHAVLLDIGMPELDGCEVARRIRAQDRHRNALLVAVTGWGQPEDRAKTKSAGFDHHLVKPVGIDLLVAALDDASLHAQR
jgi:CheY-like chemotaxis protein